MVEPETLPVSISNHETYRHGRSYFTCDEHCGAGRKVCELGSGYLSGVKSANKERAQLFEEIRRFQIVLNQLKEATEQPTTPGALQLLRGLEPDLASSLAQPTQPCVLTQCEDDMTALLQKLKPDYRFKGVWKNLKWPLKETEMAKIATRLGRYYILFTMAISAGAGKMVLDSVVINHLEENAGPGNGLTYVYCDYKDVALDAIKLISSILRLLIHNKPLSKAMRVAYKTYSERGSGIRPTVEEYTEYLKEYSAQYERLYIVIEALDECTDDYGARGILISTLRAIHSNVSLLVTSRSIDISTILPDAARLDILAHDDDVKAFVSGRLQHESMKKLSKLCTDGLYDEIQDVIAQKSQGMFLLAKLHLFLLKTLYNRAMVKKALRRLPQSLDDIYHETMLRISGAVETEKSLAFRVISWIVAAVCPFSVPELQHALVVSPEAIEPGEILDDIDSEAITESDWLVSVCAGLVAIERERQLVP
ncbi:hypothetical protein EX30DRAFT_398680 [Ascodesmis nigricans]|uniref:Nephrocystin 3-like N-terminal domain-containing protein n=1 Tax=Ascodesmis nigricans TaxID=341454 RepID=A0A4S2MR96_9PEZI|nr:hypothetical protein EX30DRAFT_398680 [Ascodesmis nigricans]